MDTASNYSSLLSALSSVKRKALLTLLIIIVYRLGTYVPLPFVDSSTYIDMLNADSSDGGGLLSVVNAISGGALGRHSVFSLNVMPYIVASIISQLFFISFAQNKDKDPYSNAQISRYTRYMTILFAIAQGVVLSLSMVKASSVSLVYMSSADLFMRHFAVVITLVAGTMVLVWLGEIITNSGIGNGISIIIFTGIVAELPKAIYATMELGRVGAYSGFFILLIFVAFAVLLSFVVFMERSTRNVAVYHPKRQVGSKLYAQQSSHIPIKLNIAGVIPAIFANTIMVAPISLAGLASAGWLKDLQPLSVLVGGVVGTALYYAFYFALMVFFAFFYTAIVFDPTDIAENLRKGGGVVAGMRPGASTAEYIRGVASRLTCIGALYVASVCVFVDLARVQYSIPFALGGTSVLIMVGVVNDVISQIQLQIFSQKYDDVIKKVGLRR